MDYLQQFQLVKTHSIRSSELERAIDKMCGLYGNKKRQSGKLVINHCLETAEYLARYRNVPIYYLIIALFHDSIEDLCVSFSELKSFFGQEGEKIARMVTILSKRPDIMDREQRDKEYMNRLSNAFLKGERDLILIKLCDRRVNLNDLNFLPSMKRKRIAIQTIQFYVPLARELGFPGLANRLKELSLPYIGLCSGAL
jgi:(p)ppGpp synthase/HD superfamily hydrolase